MIGHEVLKLLMRRVPNYHIVSPPNEKRYKLTHTCKLWEEQEDA